MKVSSLAGFSSFCPTVVIDPAVVFYNTGSLRVAGIVHLKIFPRHSFLTKGAVRVIRNAAILGRAIDRPVDPREHQLWPCPPGAKLLADEHHVLDLAPRSDAIADAEHRMPDPVVRQVVLLCKLHSDDDVQNRKAAQGKCIQSTAVPIAAADQNIADREEKTHNGPYGTSGAAARQIVFSHAQPPVVQRTLVLPAGSVTVT